MLFSVVMCVHEMNPFLDDAIISIIEQNYTHDFEFIIVANNCSDDLYEYLGKYTVNNKVKLYRTIVGQLCFNLNYAINLAQGEYIIRMDSDDVSLSNRLTICEEHLGFDVVAFSANYIDEKNNIIGENCVGSFSIEKDLIKKNPIIHPACMIKKDMLLKIKGYSGGFQSEDYDLWLRMEKVSAKFYFSNTKVLNYRISTLQSKGALLPYCEVSGYFLREWLLTFKFKYFEGLIIALMKRSIYSFKNRKAKRER